MMSLHVIWYPPIKNPGYAYEREDVLVLTLNLYARSEIRTIRFRRVPPGSERVP